MKRQSSLFDVLIPDRDACDVDECRLCLDRDLAQEKVERVKRILRGQDPDWAADKRCDRCGSWIQCERGDCKRCGYSP